MVGTRRGQGRHSVPVHFERGVLMSLGIIYRGPNRAVDGHRRLAPTQDSADRCRIGDVKLAAGIS